MLGQVRWPQGDTESGHNREREGPCGAGHPVWWNKTLLGRGLLGPLPPGPRCLCHFLPFPHCVAMSVGPWGHIVRNQWAEVSESPAATVMCAVICSRRLTDACKTHLVAVK